MLRAAPALAVLVLAASSALGGAARRTDCNADAGCLHRRDKGLAAGTKVVCKRARISCIGKSRDPLWTAQFFRRGGHHQPPLQKGGEDTLVKRDMAESSPIKSGTAGHDGLALSRCWVTLRHPQITRQRPARQTKPYGQTRARGTTTTGAGATTTLGTTTRGATTTAPPLGRHPP